MNLKRILPHLASILVFISYILVSFFYIALSSAFFYFVSAGCGSAESGFVFDDESDKGSSAVYSKTVVSPESLYSISP